jgi:lysophospholipase L1-like esterase
MLVLGDSIPWGLGLQEGNKFHSIVASRIGAELGYSKVHKKVLAHSGAILGTNTETYAGDTEVHGEVNRDYPTIFQQCDAFDGLKRSIDLILVDGGINDIGVSNLLNPFLDDSSLQDKIDTVFYSNMKALLRKLTRQYPNAIVIVTSYYAIVSNGTNFEKLEAWLSALGLVVKVLDLFEEDVIEQSRLFSAHSRTMLQKAISEVNESLREERVHFAIPHFTDYNAVFASKSWLWGLDRVDDGVRVTDEVSGTRFRECEKYDSGVFLCKISSVGHPNVTGAQKYAEKIVEILERVGVLSA